MHHSVKFRCQYPLHSSFFARESDPRNHHEETGQNTSSISLSRRLFITAALVAPFSGRAQAMAPLLPWVAPAIVAGLFALWQGARDRKYQQEAMDLQRASLRVELAKFQHMVERGDKDAEINLLVHLMGKAEREDMLVLAQHPYLQKVIKDSNGRVSSGVLSTNAEGAGVGTSLLLQDGQLAVSRGYTGGLMHNAEAVAAGETSQRSGDPVAVPLGAPVGNFSDSETRAIRRAIADREGVDPTNISLMAERRYSVERNANRANLQGVTYLTDASNQVRFRFFPQA